MNKTVLITGASRGIGRACAEKFAKEGYNVILCCSAPSKHADDALVLIQKHSPDSMLLTFDIKDSAAVSDAVACALSHYDRIDALVLCAGIAKQELFQFTSESAYDDIMDTNVKGSFLVTKEVIPNMIKNQSGSIVFISSMWGQVGASMEVIYSASKAAIIGMTKALAKEVAPSMIRVNCVCPGVIETDMTASLGKETLDMLANETPMGRNGTPCDVANAVYFLSSEGASFITGDILSVNGGLVI